MKAADLVGQAAVEQAQLLRLVLESEYDPDPEKVGTIDGRWRYLGHAHVTKLLIEHDPCWTWEPMKDENGRPLIYSKDGIPTGLWITLTVHGVTRPGFGSCKVTDREPMKVLIGDAIRNAAMRFGIALSLWVRDEERGVSDGEG